ncbi:MAG TPA: hypothetical protein P5274_03025 [Candidatus Paceibacterota bacterium]|nr:hypothetical protein [Candidatus Paceibacterota bacterium]
MSIFEALMIICFGLSWPFSIWKAYHTHQNGSKSVLFLWLIWLGYFAGIIHKIFYNYDLVILLYILNSLMVSIDIALFYRNGKEEKNAVSK